MMVRSCRCRPVALDIENRWDGVFLFTFNRVGMVLDPLLR